MQRKKVRKVKKALVDIEPISTTSSIPEQNIGKTPLHNGVLSNIMQFMVASSGTLMGLDCFTPSSSLLITSVASLWPIILSAHILTQQVFNYS